MPLRDAIRRTVHSGPSPLQDVVAQRVGQLFGVARARERELWFAVVAVMLVDITLTVHGLTLGLPEANPVARAAIDTAGVLGLYGLKAIALAIGVGCRLIVEDRYGFVVPLGLGIPSLAAVFINSAVLAVVVL